MKEGVIVATKKPAAEKAKPAPKKSTKPKKAEKPSGGDMVKGPAQCVFDLYNLRFGMTKEEVSKVLDFAESGHLNEEALLKTGADIIEIFFDHMDRLWQVKAHYKIHDMSEAEALLDRMSKDYRFQTSTSRVAFETVEEEDHMKLYIRYSEINLKRMYLHHMMAVGAAKIAEAEELEKAIKEKEEEEYIPTGPMMF